MSSGPVHIRVESPFVDQLIGIGWKPIAGNLDPPSETERETFRKVLASLTLRKAVERTNQRDGSGRSVIAAWARSVRDRCGGTTSPTRGPRREELRAVKYTLIECLLIGSEWGTSCPTESAT